MRSTKLVPVLIGVALVFGAGPANAQPSEGESAEATAPGRPPNKANAHFLAGVAAMREDTTEGYEIARREFRAAFQEYPSWKILGNWGIAAHRLMRHGEALGLFERYLEEGGDEIELQERQQVRSDIETLRREVATLRVEPPGGWATYWVVDRYLSADKEIVNRYGPFRGSTILSVGFGNREVFLENEDQQRTKIWTVLLMPGDLAEHQYDSASPPKKAAEVLPPLEPLPPVDSGGWRSTAAYVAWGGGVISGGIAVGALLHASSLDREADRAFNRSCPQGPQPGDPDCPQTTDDDRAVAAWRSVALAGGIAAGVAISLGTWFYVTDDGGILGASVGPRTLRFYGTF